MRYFVSLLMFILIPAFLQAKIIMTPYLQAVTTNSVIVLVECDQPDPVTVNFGLTPGFGSTARTEFIALTTANPVTYVHRVLLSGLAQSTTYFYKATQGKSSSDEASFSTAVAAGTPFRMVWMADCRTGTPIFAKISRNMLSVNPRVALYGGDLCYSSTYKIWKKQFFIKDQLDFASRVPFFNTPGNHEGWEQNTKAFTQNPDSGSGTQDYYSFDYGDVHVLCINTLIPYTEGSPQFEFAKKDLEQSKQPWKIVMSHAPAYCGGGHGDDPEMIAMAGKIFEKNNVDLVFSGHSHFYQHNLVNGIHYMVIGSAGAPLYSPDKASYTVTQAKDYNFGVIDASATNIKIVVYNAEMAVLDSLEIVK